MKRLPYLLLLVATLSAGAITAAAPAGAGVCKPDAKGVWRDQGRFCDKPSGTTPGSTPGTTPGTMVATTTTAPDTAGDVEATAAVAVRVTPRYAG